MPPVSDSTLALAKQLISYQSTVDRPDELHRVLELALAELDGFTVERFTDQGVESALVYAAPERPQVFEVILNGHLDVTPGTPEQYTPRTQGDRLYGVGAMDMKASIASLIHAFKAVARSLPYDIGLQLTTDEQQGGFHGTKYQIAQGVQANFVIAGESTALNIAHQAKGVIWAKITAKGSSAHSAYPWKSRNPVWDIHTLLDRVKARFPPPTAESQATTVAISNIETTSTTFNKTPDSCTAWLDIRYTAAVATTILDTLTMLVPNTARVEIIAHEPALYADPHSPYIVALSHAAATQGADATLYGAHGSSDARHYASTGSVCVEFGPTGDGIGTDTEWVSIASLEQYKRTLQEFLLKLQPRLRS